MKTIAIFNPAESTLGFVSRDVSTVQVEEFTPDAVLAAMLAKKWHVREEGVYAAQDTEPDSDFKELMLFRVTDVTPKGPTWEARTI